MPSNPSQLISFIAPAAPATRRPALGTEAYLRPEIGFTPNWYREALEIDFDERWHNDPAHRRETVLRMREELRSRFAGTRIGRIDETEGPLDLLTGTYGATTVAALFGVPIIYAPNNWPTCEHRYLSDEEVDRIEPVDLETNDFFRRLLDQIDWIAEMEGRAVGYINWQGILNNAQRLRGENIFFDLVAEPERCHRLFEAVCVTLIEGCKALQRKQAEQGFESSFFTVSNCFVNMVSPKIYREMLLPFDIRIAEAFGSIGIHNCAWNANPYLRDYATVPNLAYIDMGLESDLSLARELIPQARRALMYTPMDLVNKSAEEKRADFERFAREYGPCDLVLADIEAGTPDRIVWEAIDLCAEISERMETSASR